MTSAPVRDPLADHLITPQNAALLLIDYQPAQLAAVRSAAIGEGSMAVALIHRRLAELGGD
jgi:nicotinamidase-related amidase